MSGAPSAVVLLSGGMDSAVTLACMRRDGFRCIALSFDYGQRHRIEIERAGRVARALGAAEHAVQRIDLRSFGGSALTADIAVPKDQAPARQRTAGESIPVTYVPARNTVFLSFALALAEVRGASAIAIGANAVDYSGYPDCRPAFIEAFERLANLATRAGVEAASAGQVAIRVHAPLMDLTKRHIVELGQRLGVDFSLTTSCYDPSPEGAPCGHCDACILRARGFADAGVTDPLCADSGRLS